MSTLIRAAVPNDCEAIVELTQAIADWEKAAFNSTGKAEKINTAIFETKRLHCLLAETDQVISGFVTYSIEFSLFEAADYLRMNSLYIKPEFRRNGIGKALVEALYPIAKGLQLNSIRFFTPEFNQAAIDFYTSLGATSNYAVRFQLPV